MNKAHIFLVLLFFLLSSESFSKNLYVGVLENIPNRASKLNQRIIRILYEKVDNGWESMKFKEGLSSYPEKLNWYVTFDGKNIGKINSVLFKETNPSVNFLSRDTHHILESQDKIPVIGKLSTEFSGWIYKESYRPLILVTQNNYRDPENWKPAMLNKDLLYILLAQFKLTIDYAEVLDVENDSTRQINDIKASDLALYKSYKSNTGKMLVQIGFRGFVDCQGQGEYICPNRWFYLKKDIDPKYIGSGMKLIDAGDYDEDGFSEVVFWIAGYNYDGYKMFFDDFSESSEYSWKYH